MKLGSWNLDDKSWIIKPEGIPGSESCLELVKKNTNYRSRRRSVKGNRVLRVNNVSKRAKDFQILNKVSFELGSGEIVGLIGPNGAGKTSIMKILVDRKSVV